MHTTTSIKAVKSSVDAAAGAVGTLAGRRLLLPLLQLTLLSLLAAEGTETITLKWAPEQMLQQQQEIQ